MLAEIDSRLPLSGPRKQLVELLLGHVVAESCVEEEEAVELESIEVVLQHTPPEPAPVRARTVPVCADDTENPYERAPTTGSQELHGASAQAARDRDRVHQSDSQTGVTGAVRCGPACFLPCCKHMPSCSCPRSFPMLLLAMCAGQQLPHTS